MRVCLVEFNTWHGECLAPQIAYLKACGDDVTLICPRRTLGAIAPDALDGVDYAECAVKKSLGNVWSVWRKIKKGRFDVVVLNTAQGSESLKLCLLDTFGRVPFVGTLHNIVKLRNSLGQRMISKRMSGYLTIAPYLLNRLQSVCCIPSGCFSPLSAEKCCATDVSASEVKNSERIIVIPGNVEFKRRDYAALVPMAHNLPGAKFVILGNANKADGPSFREMVANEGLSDRFTFFDGFVEESLFDDYMRKADYLLPLIDKVLADDYLNHKTSGTFTLALRYGKTMLCDRALEPLKDDYPCVFYDSIADMAKVVESGLTAQPKPLVFSDEAERYCGFLRRIVANGK